MFNNSKVGDKVICNGFPGIVIRNKHSPDSKWMGGIENGEEWGMVEVAFDTSKKKEIEK